MQGIAKFRRNSNKEEDEIILSDYLRILWNRKFLIALFVLMALTLAYVKMRYEDRIYKAQGSIKIESENNNLLSEVSILKDLNPKDKVLTETYILRSKRLVLKACANLPIQTSYYSKGRLVNKELYKNSPFFINLIGQEPAEFGKNYDVTILDSQRFEMNWMDERGEPMALKARFGDTIEFDGNRAYVKFNARQYESTGTFTNNYSFTFNSATTLYGRISSGLEVDPADKGVSLLIIGYKDVVPEFASDFINELFKVYINFDVEIKSQTATQTIEFMERLMRDMDETVKGSEQNMEQFKRNNNLVNLDVKGENSLKNLTELELQKRMLSLQLLSYESLEKQINESRNSTFLPISINGMVDPVLAELLSGLSKLNMEKITRSEKMTPNNPALQELDKQIEEIKRSVRQNVLSAKRKLAAQAEFIDKQIETIQENLKSLPTEEKELLTLQRDLEVNQKVYGFLLQTRLEAAISKASIVSSARVIDNAEFSRTPISPKKKTTYLIYFIVSFLFSCAFILIWFALNNKILAVADIEMLTDIPVIGSILAYSRKLKNDQSRMLAISEQRSLFGESLRSVRTNLQFLLPEKEKKVITISSTISGEGKTFTSINIAGCLTLLDKKVVLIGCDMRKPQLAATFRNVNPEAGLSSYLAGKSSFEEVLVQSEFKNLSVILSGPIPPNPAELLLSNRMLDLLDRLRNDFDYIILDSSPVGLVSDAVALMKMSDIVIYVLKSGFSKKEFIELPYKIIEEHGLRNFYLLLNSCEINHVVGKGGYYGYGGENVGYYTETNTVSRLRRWLNKLMN